MSVELAVKVQRPQALATISKVGVWGMCISLGGGGERGVGGQGAAAAGPGHHARWGWGMCISMERSICLEGG